MEYAPSSAPSPPEAGRAARDERSTTRRYRDWISSAVARARHREPHAHASDGAYAEHATISRPKACVLAVPVRPDMETLMPSLLAQSSSKEFAPRVLTPKVSNEYKKGVIAPKPVKEFPPSVIAPKPQKEFIPRGIPSNPHHDFSRSVLLPPPSFAAPVPVTSFVHHLNSPELFISQSSIHNHSQSTGLPLPSFTRHPVYATKLPFQASAMDAAGQITGIEPVTCFPSDLSLEMTKSLLLPPYKKRRQYINGQDDIEMLNHIMGPARALMNGQRNLDALHERSQKDVVGSLERELIMDCRRAACGEASDHQRNPPRAHCIAPSITSAHQMSFTPEVAMCDERRGCCSAEGNLQWDQSTRHQTLAFLDSIHTARKAACAAVESRQESHEPCGTSQEVALRDLHGAELCEETSFQTDHVGSDTELASEKTTVSGAGSVEGGR